MPGTALGAPVRQRVGIDADHRREGGLGDDSSPRGESRMTATRPWAVHLGIDQPASATVTATLTDDVLTITVTGEVDAAARTPFDDALCDFITAHTPRQVVIDL